MYRVIFLFLSLFPSLISATEYPYIYRSAHFLGRGDTGISEADDADAIFYNPAGLAKGSGIFKKVVIASPMLEISQDTRDVIKQISIQNSDPTDTLRNRLGKPQHFGINNISGVILRRVAMGAFGHNSNTVLLYKDHTKGALESLLVDSMTDAGLFFSLAQDWSPQFSMGMTGKYFKRNQTYFHANATEASELEELDSSDQITMTGTGFGADLGMMYRSKGRSSHSFGLTIQDLGNTVIVPDEETTLSKEERPLKDITQTVNVGYSISTATKASEFKFLVDIRDVLSSLDFHFSKRIHLGSELNVNNFIGFVTGLNQGLNCFGLFLNLSIARLDLGFYSEEVGQSTGSRPDKRYYVKIQAGL